MVTPAPSSSRLVANREGVAQGRETHRAASHVDHVGDTRIVQELARPHTAAASLANDVHRDCFAKQLH